MANEIISCRIREGSRLAWLAARKLNDSRMAVTLGSSIHLWNASSEDFLGDTRWLRHELCHVRQFRQYGFLYFLWLYLIESVRHGYQMNRFEVQAREASNRQDSIAEYSFESC